MSDITIKTLDLERQIAEAQAATAAQHAAAQLPALLAERAERERVAAMAAQQPPLQRQVDELLPALDQATINRDAAIKRLFAAWEVAINAAMAVGELAYQIDQAAEALAKHQITAQNAYPSPPVRVHHDFQNTHANAQWSQQRIDLEATYKYRILQQAGIQMGSENTAKLIPSDDAAHAALADVLTRQVNTRGGMQPRIGLTITY